MTAAHHFDNKLRYLGGGDNRHRYLTPAYVLDPVRQLLGTIELDPCSEGNNPTGAKRFYCPPQDGLSLPWDAATVWCNPPYMKAREPWVDRCIAESGRGARIVLLMPASTDTRTFQRALASSTTCLFLQGRVKFGVLRENRRQEAASHGSALIGFGVDLTPLNDLGVVARPADRIISGGPA